MRSLIFAFPIWLGVVQLPIGGRLESGQQLAVFCTVAGALASATAMVYRLGSWRQEMEHLKHNVAGEIARYSAASAQAFARLDERFVTIDRSLAAVAEQRVATERWQARIDATLESMEARLSRIEQASDREAV